MSVLLRLSEVSGGVVAIDGRDVRSLPLAQLRRAVGLVPQSPFLFEVLVQLPLPSAINYIAKRVELGDLC